MRCQMCLFCGRKKSKVPMIADARAKEELFRSTAPRMVRSASRFCGSLSESSDGDLRLRSNETAVPIFALVGRELGANPAPTALSRRGEGRHTGEAVLRRGQCIYSSSGTLSRVRRPIAWTDIKKHTSNSYASAVVPDHA